MMMGLFTASIGVMWLAASLSVIAPVHLARSGADAVSMALVNVFCAGVIIATSLVHMLPDAVEMMHSLPSASVGIAFGSALIIMITAEVMSRDLRGCAPISCSGGGEDAEEGLARGPGAAQGYGAVETMERHYGVKPNSHSHSHARDLIDGFGSGAQNLLLGSMSLHALLEGLGLAGLSTSPHFVFLLCAITFHKCLAGIAIGSELLRLGEAEQRRKTWRAAVIFATAAPVGAFCGIGVRALGESRRTIEDVSGILTAIAAGTLLFVAVSEILPNGIGCCRDHRGSAISVLFLGFSIMSILGLYV